MPYKDKKVQKEWQEAWRLERMTLKRNYINEVKKGGCIICGETEPICLDFHHLRDKEDRVSKFVVDSSPLERLKAEVEKCVILCCKHHRMFHAGMIKLPIGAGA